PDESESLALLALMLLHDSRRAARFVSGELVLLDDQNRELWDQAQIDEGRELLQLAIARPGRGRDVSQAAIADLHLEAPRDWDEIAILYGVLAELTRSPIVEMNRAVALAEIDRPEAALELIDRLPLDDYRYFHSTRADFLRRLAPKPPAR